ncbi:hypothetical protein QQS21_008735 [Conoideocrella luteorostrata]|uniref:Heterokaryon incompatibility domain-containing protein n=1 Tax=Conoideocrella luteorostrata TaxID=1105319 RepID=A0AAJ0CIJ0_9HYPO|nr:hypothetical protein QQS21_008735 [Conoideocrella luteorostrata]
MIADSRILPQTSPPTPNTGIYYRSENLLAYVDAYRRVLTMRLINAETWALENFVGKNIPPYAILSHTWGEDEEELSFHDLQTGNIEKAGKRKIKLQGCCEQAKKDKLRYIWIDTCCIDKANAVELSEAINSMFRWYKKASICYAYLSDVPSGDNSTDPNSKFFSSRWFQRGWTLQELLAPQELCFYDQTWMSIGTKRDMSSEIQTITGIPWRFLRVLDVYNASVAQRMSWAAKRETTREEDLAYCLIGVFGVNMPMIYGEGDQAFIRLQEAIMKKTRDDSILAWGIGPAGSTPPNNAISAGILATSPSNFTNCGGIVLKKQDATPVNTFDISGGRLQVHLSLYATSASEIYGLLNCGPEHSTEHVVGIPLCKTVPDEQSGEYFRPQGHSAALIPRTASSVLPKGIRIQTERQSMAREAAGKRYWFHISGYRPINLKLIEDYPPEEWKIGSAMIAKESNENITRRYFARFRSQDEGSQDFIVLLELEIQGLHIQPRCHIMISSRDNTLEELSHGLIYMRQEAFGRQTASNDRLKLKVAVKEQYSAQGPMYIVELAQTSNSVEVTVDATLELQQAKLKRELIRILEDEDQAGLETRQLDQQCQRTTALLDQTKERLAVVEESLKNLGEKKDILVGELEKECEQVDQLTKKRNEVGQRHERLSKQNSAIQMRLHELYSRQSLGNWLEMIIKTQLSGDQIDRISKGVEDVNSNNLQPSKRVKSGHNIDDYTPLLWAAKKGYTATARLLIEQGAAIEAQNSHGSTPLIAAAANGHEAAARLLIEQGATIEAHNSYGSTPLIAAAANGHEAAARLLIEQGAAIEAQDSYGSTPLIAAAANGHEAAARLLIEQGAAIEAQDSYGSTPLIAAAANGHEAAARLLIEQGAAIEAQDSYGSTPLIAAAANGHEAAARLLIEQGAAIEAQDSYGSTPLIAAAANGHEAAARLLIEQGAAIEAHNSYGSTPLMFAAENGHEAAARLLVKQGAAIEAQDSDGSTPLMFAAENGHEAVARLLIEQGAAIEAQDSDGSTPLIAAAANGHEAAARLLIEQGAAIEAHNKGSTPLMFAAANGHRSVERLLIEQSAMETAADVGSQNVIKPNLRILSKIVIRRGHKHDRQGCHDSAASGRCWCESRRHGDTFGSENDAGQENLVTVEPVPPNGGYGWICTFTVFLINAHTWGVNEVSV